MKYAQTLWLLIAIILMIGFTVMGCEENDSTKTCSHTFSEWEVITPSTADNDGVEIRTCTKYGHTEKRPIPAGTGDPNCSHVYGEWEITTPPTETENGEQTRHCNKCGHKQTHTLPAIGDPNCEHSYDAWTIIRPAACDQEGEQERTCTKCPRKEIDPISVIEHAYGRWVTTTPPTETENGEETRTCSACGHHITRPIAATGSDPDCEHMWSAPYIYEPTCTEDGWESLHCYNCNRIEVSTIDKLGHIMDEDGWYEMSAPSCVSEGVERNDCQRWFVGWEWRRCEGFETRPIATNEQHDFSGWTQTIPATETTNGEEESVCQRTGCTETTTRPIYFSTPGLEFLLINNNTEYSVSKGTATAAHIIIPVMYNGLPVTEINTNAFRNYSDLTSITIPDSVTSISYDAFYGCTGLTSITIPDSVTSIGSGAFRGCSSLTSITIGNSVTSIGSEAFRGCPGLTSITIPDSVTSIGSSAFQDCTGLTNITIPASVTSIGNSAFSGCRGLTSITIPNSVTSIGSYAFSGCTGLTSITIPGNVTIIGSFAFQDYTGLTNITIPGSVTIIGERAFYNCSGLTSVTIQGNITSANFSSDTFPGDLRTKYLAVSGGPGTYTRPNGSSTWTKQP